MPRFAESISSRHAPRFAVLALVSLGFAGCSANTSTRFTDNPSPQWSNPFKDWSNPFASKNETTGSVQQQPRELPQYARPRYSSSAPVVSAPLSYPSGPTVSGGGHGVSSYAPPSSSPIESTGSVTPPSVAATRAYTREGGTTIIVGTSDTLEIISKRYNVPSHEIMAANGYNGPRVLQPGQQLIIPKRIAQSAPPAMSSAPATRATGPMPSSMHVVNRGDTLNNIARRNHISVGQLAAANNLTTMSQLKIGQHIKVPGGQVAAVAPAQPQQAMAAPQPVVAAKPVAVATTEQPQRAQLANEKTAPEAPESAVKTADATNALPTFRWPVRGRVVTAYGAKANGKQNDGINIAVPEGTPVKAAEDGVVAYSGNELKGYGNLILVRHANGYVTAYAHASELMVKRGDSIKRGQVIAKSGQTGEVSSPQLHFEIRKGSTAVDPTQFLGGA